MRIESAALRIAETIDHYNDLHHVSIDKMKVVLTLLIHNAIILTTSLTVGVITGSLGDTMAGALYLYLLRKLSGGADARTLELCALITIVTLCSIPHINLSPVGVMIVNLFNVAVMLIWSPQADDVDVPKFLLKMSSCLLVSTNFIAGSSTIALAFLAQAISLLPLWKGVNEYEA